GERPRLHADRRVLPGEHLPGLPHQRLPDVQAGEVELRRGGGNPEAVSDRVRGPPTVTPSAAATPGFPPSRGPTRRRSSDGTIRPRHPPGCRTRTPGGVSRTAAETPGCTRRRRRRSAAAAAAPGR